jgi:hypothetical protein
MNYNFPRTKTYKTGTDVAQLRSLKLRFCYTKCANKSVTDLLSLYCVFVSMKNNTIFLPITIGLWTIKE